MVEVLAALTLGLLGWLAAGIIFGRIVKYANKEDK